MIADTLTAAVPARAASDAAVRPAASPQPAAPAVAAAPAPAPAWNDAVLAAALLAPGAADMPALPEGAGNAADDTAAADTDTADAPADWPGALQVDVLATLWRAVQAPEAAPPVAAAAAAPGAASGSTPPAVAGAALPAAPALPVPAAPVPSASQATPGESVPPAAVAGPETVRTPAAAVQTPSPVPPPVQTAPAAEPAPAGDAAETPATLAAADAPAATRSTPAAAEAAPALKLPAARDAWNQPLVQALGERLRLQLGQGVEQATIRLDPPELGSIEIVVRREAGAVHVQLSASHPDVQRQLQQLGEPLRQELAQRQGAEASVEVARHGADADGRGSREQAQREAEVGRALAEAGDEDAAPFNFPTRHTA